MMIPLFLLIIIGLDQASKFWTVSYFASSNALSAPAPDIILFKNIFGIKGSLTYIANYGAIWGLFSSMPHLLVTARIFLVCAMLIGIYSYRPQNKRLLMGALLIISGATSNIFDYFIYGHVVDMIQVNLWGFNYPVFNIADSCICIGVAAFILDSILTSRNTHVSKNHT